MLLRLFPLWTSSVLATLGARRRELEIDGGRLVYYEAGPADGEPWILLHGLASTTFCWQRVVRAMRRDTRLILPELSSLGGTLVPGSALNVPEGARALEALVEDRAPDRTVTLAGISLGGWMAVRFALERPDLVGRMVLVDAAGYEHQDWDRIQSLVEVDSLEDVDRLYGALFHRTPLLLSLVRRGFYRAYTSPAVRRILASTEEAHAYGPTELAAIQAPTLLVWGASDGLFLPEVGHAMQAHLPESELLVLDRVGHAIHWETPARMTEALQRFQRAGLDAFRGGALAHHAA